MTRAGASRMGGVRETEGRQPLAARTREVLFPAYRRFEHARVETNDAMMALLVGSRLGDHALSLAPSPDHRIRDVFSEVDEIQRLDRTVKDARSLIAQAEVHLAFMAIPYSLSVYAGLLADCIAMLRLENGVVDAGDPRDIPLSGLHAAFVTAASTDLTALPATHLRLFDFARWMRNRIVHRGAIAGAKLVDHYESKLSADDRAEWTRVARQDPDFGKNQIAMNLGWPELRATLSITKNLARAANGVMADRLPRHAWASLAVRDYRQAAHNPHWNSVSVKSLIGFSAMTYGPLGLSDLELADALSKEKADALPLS